MFFFLKSSLFIYLCFNEKLDLQRGTLKDSSFSPFIYFSCFINTIDETRKRKITRIFKVLGFRMCVEIKKKIQINFQLHPELTPSKNISILAKFIYDNLT